MVKIDSSYIYHPLSIYVLGEYNISFRQIKYLSEEGYTLADFKGNTILAQHLSKKKKALYNKVQNIIPCIDSTIFSESVYKLAAADLSEKNILLLKEYGISYTDIRDLTYESFISILNSASSKEAIFQRIKDAYQKAEGSVENSFDKNSVNQKIYTNLLTNFFESLPPRKFVSLLEIKQYILRNYKRSAELDDELIQEILEKKIKKNLIYTVDLMFAKKYTKIKTYLEENNFKNKDILIQKLNNRTLQEIADEYNLTRERIRQIIIKLLNNMPVMEEVIVYQTVFEQYDWDEKLFNMVYNEHPYVYQLLKLKLKKGTKKVLDYLDNIALTKEQRNIVLQYFNHYINFENKIVPFSNKMKLFENLVYNLGSIAVQSDEFIEIANEFIESKNLPEHMKFDKFSVNGLADRSNYVLRTNKHGFRFYNISNLDNHEIQQLKQLLNLEPGIYSTAKLFRENMELMDSLNIDSEYELHNLYKKAINLPSIEYTRMPEFSVGNISKDEFMKSLFNELAPITLDNIANYIEQEYGLKYASIRALISSDYIEFIHGNEIITNHNDLTEEEFNQLKALLTKDIYTIEEFSKKGKTLDEHFRDKFINNYTLLQVGYYIRGMFILSTKYNSVEQYFSEYLLNQDIFQNTRSPVYQTSSFNATLYELEQSLDAIRIDRDIYITSKKLNAVGIFKEQLIEYREAVYSFASDIPYFTLPQIRKLGFNHELEEFGFSDLFYERIIWSHPSIQSIHTVSHIIFKTGSDVANLTSFINYIMYEHIQLDLYAFLEKVANKYEVNLNQNRIIELINKSIMHYSPEMERIYLDKETFFKDIYYKKDVH